MSQLRIEVLLNEALNVESQETGNLLHTSIMAFPLELREFTGGRRG
jgi:hypothetical protein